MNNNTVENTKFECLSCTLTYETCKEQDLICPENHFFCSTNKCAQTYLDLVFSEPHIYYPGKCPMCKQTFTQLQLEAIMNETQKKIFSELNLKFGPEAEKNQIINLANSMESLVLIDNEETKLNEIRTIVLSIIENESQVSCPKCFLAGRKDLECTHITCTSCGTIYCYVCGKEESELNKSDSSNDIFAHNEDWMTLEERCPMYLREIPESDERYDAYDEETAMNFFHSLKIKIALKNFFENLDEEEIEKMEEKYKILKSYDFTLEEVLSQEELLIKRS